MTELNLNIFIAPLKAGDTLGVRERALLTVLIISKGE